MLLVISPAKSMDFDTPSTIEQSTHPKFLSEATMVNKELRKLKAEQLAKLMDISSKLAELNFERNQLWSENPSVENIKQAVLAFSGDVYQGLQAETFSEEQMKLAQERIRILSGLYGLLRPLDLIQPYRLEMGTNLSVKGRKDLYEFWKDKITAQLQSELKTNGNILINLASNEYFKVLDTKKLDAQIITPIFKDFKGGQYKMISFFAKRARGLMCRFVIENNLTEPEDLKAFDLEGYYFNSGLSKESEWVFTREH